LGIGGTLCDASPSATDGTQIHLRHKCMGVTDIGGSGGGKNIEQRWLVGVEEHRARLGDGSY
jgi:hypothetical protein